MQADTSPSSDGGLYIWGRVGIPGRALRGLGLCCASRLTPRPDAHRMASEKTGYNLFPSYPVTGPLTSQAFALSGSNSGASVSLGGTSFSARVQVSNAQNPGPKPDHLFIPPDGSFDDSVTLTPSSPPQAIPGPIRWVRVVLDSGTLTGGNVVEQQDASRNVLDLASLISQQTGDTVNWTLGDHSTLPATPGLYQIVNGLEAGQKWLVASGSSPVRRADLEGTTATGLSQLFAVTYVTANLAGSTDATASLQSLIDALPGGGVLDGGSRTYTVTSLQLKSDMTLRNIRLTTLAGTADFVAPVTIDGRPTTSDLSSGVKQNIILRNVYVDGNRTNQTNIISAAENGGRHGFRLIGRVWNLLIEDCTAVNCAGDGLELYSWSGRNQTSDSDLAFRNIVIRRSRFNGNRRHGASFDSIQGVSIESGCQFNNNGNDLAGVTGATPYTDGNRGDTVGGSHLTYGAGIDFEGYGVGSGIDGLTISGIEATGNARQGLLFYDNTQATATGFVPRRKIRISGSTLGGGVGSSTTGEALTFTSTIANKTLGNLYDDITLRDNTLLGYLLLRAVGSVTNDGGTIDHTAAPVIADHCGSVNLGRVVYKTNATPFADTATLLQTVTQQIGGSAAVVPPPLPIGVQVVSNSAVSDQYALLATLPAAQFGNHRFVVNLYGGGQNGTDVRTQEITLGNFNNLLGYTLTQSGTQGTGLSVVAYTQGDNTVQVHLKVTASKYVHGLVRAVYALQNNAPVAVTSLALGTTVPSGTLNFDSGNSATYPVTTVTTVATLANLTAPTAPTLSNTAGATGTLTLVSATAMGTTPYTVSYRLVYTFTPSVSGGYTQFTVSTPSGYSLLPFIPGAYLTATSVPVQGIGPGGGLGRFHTSNTTTGEITMTVLAQFSKN